MAIDAFYKKSFQIQCDFPSTKIEKDKQIIYNSPEQWAGGFPWSVSLQYKCPGRKGSAYLSVFIKVAKCMDSDWVCTATSNFRLISCQPDVRDLTWVIQKEYKNSANSWGIQKFCEWIKLPAYVKDGKMNLEVNLTIDKDSCKGGALPPGAIDELLEKKTLENNQLKSELQQSDAKLAEANEEKDREIALLKSQLEKIRTRLDKLRKKDLE